jgi:hypothetical protein
VSYEFPDGSDVGSARSVRSWIDAKAEVTDIQLDAATKDLEFGAVTDGCLQLKASAAEAYLLPCNKCRASSCRVVELPLMSFSLHTVLDDF